MYADRRIDHVIGVTKHQWRGLAGIRGNEKRDNGCRVTGFMEILQVQCVVPHLVDGGGIKSRLAHLELDYEEDSLSEKDAIDATPHPRNVEFEVKHRVEPQKLHAEKINLIVPRSALSLPELVVVAVIREVSNDAL